MNKKTKRIHTSASTVTQLPLYTKALEICTLSFGLRTLYTSKHVSDFREPTEMISDHHMDALIMTAIGLPQSIAQAAVTKDLFAHHGFYNYIKLATKQVAHHLRMLRRHKGLQDTQCSALINALKEFGRLHKQWSILQLHKN